MRWIGSINWGLIVALALNCLVWWGIDRLAKRPWIQDCDPHCRVVALR